MRKLLLPWKGINVKINYEENYSEAFLKVMGFSIAHIEVEAKTPLPITETGYRSLYLPTKEVEEAGGAVALVNEWLNEAAKSKEWKEYQKEKNQLKLF